MNDEYKKYLESDAWRKKREKVLDRDGHACQICGSKENLRVHHKKYNPDFYLGEEPENDLITVCERCHEDIHELKKAYIDNRAKINRESYDKFKNLVVDTLMHRDKAFGGDLNLAKNNNAMNKYAQKIIENLPLYDKSVANRMVCLELCPGGYQTVFIRKRKQELGE